MAYNLLAPATYLDPYAGNDCGYSYE
jgi:hypothetical protein